MGDYNLSWEDLKKALKNESACDRYENGYRAEKEMSEVESAAERLKAQMKGGRIYGMPCVVQCR